MRKELLDCINSLTEQNRSYVLATVVETLGSCSAKPGAKAVIDARGTLLCGWVGGGCVEAMVRETALSCLKTQSPTLIEVDLDEEVFGAGMPCGGSMRVYIEPVLPANTLWITGHGRIAEVLCQLGELLGLRVVVDDPRAIPEKFPRAVLITEDNMDYARLQPRPGDFVVIATQHRGDYAAIRRALAAKPIYIGLIASHRRASLVMARLREEGLDAGELGRVHTPAGLSIGADTPEEIALAIMAEITAVRRASDGSVGAS